MHRNAPRPAVVGGRLIPLPAVSRFFGSHPLQLSEFTSFSVGKQRAITARKQRENSEKTARKQRENSEKTARKQRENSAITAAEQRDINDIFATNSARPSARS
jgi:hypothetical protein